MKTVLAVIGALVALCALAWLIQGNEFFIYKVFAPKREAVRREVFEESKAYRQGMVQELQNMQMDYVQAEPEHKAALASIILHRAAEFPEEDMPADLRSFIQQLKADEGLTSGGY